MLTHSRLCQAVLRRYATIRRAGDDYRAELTALSLRANAARSHRVPGRSSVRFQATVGVVCRPQRRRIGL